MKSREILEAIKALSDETHRDAAMNQLIITGNSNHDKLNSILIILSQAISTASPSSSPLKESNGLKPKDLSSLERYTSIFIKNYVNIPENIPIIVSHDFILLKLVQEMKTNITALESLACLSSHHEGKKKLIEIPDLLNSLVQNLMQPSSSASNPKKKTKESEEEEEEEENEVNEFFISSMYLFHNLLELGKTRELIQQIDEFTKPNLYHKLYQSQNQFPADIICSILMQISRTSISHQAMYAVDGVLSMLLNVIHTSHHPLVKLCLICLMNLSSEASNRLSMITNKPLLSSIIAMARLHKRKVRQCSIGVLLNLSFAAIHNPQLGLYLLQFPQAIEVIVLSIHAIGEVTTQCYGMGILCNLTTSLENKIQLIQHPSVPSLLTSFHTIFSLEEEEEEEKESVGGEEALNSPRGLIAPLSSLSSSPQRKSMKNFWILKNDSCQVFYNLSHFTSSPAPSDDPLSSENKQLILHWQRRICLEKDLLLRCLCIATRSQASTIHNHTRTNCLQAIGHLLPTLSFLLSSASVTAEELMELRLLFSTIHQELSSLTGTRTSTPPSLSSTNRKIALEMIEMMTPYTNILTLVATTSSDEKKNVIVSSREPLPLSKSHQKKKQQSSKSSLHQKPSLTPSPLEFNDDTRAMAITTADGKLPSSTSQSSSTKKSSKMTKSKR